jgi:hypothetical protein
MKRLLFLLLPPLCSRALTPMVRPSTYMTEHTPVKLWLALFTAKVCGLISDGDKYVGDFKGDKAHNP